MKGNDMRKVDEAVQKVMDLVNKKGIGKDRQAGKDGGPRYNYRGVDDVYDLLGENLVLAGLAIYPSYEILVREERPTKTGGLATYVIVRGSFKLRSVEDESHETVAFLGEALDNSDKAIKKAESACYAYMAFQTFNIPLNGIDSEQDHIEPAKPVQAARKPL